MARCLVYSNRMRIGAFGNLKPYIMRNLILLLTVLVFGTSATMANTTEDKVAIRNAYNYNNSFIFVENGITFSVFPDGEFDFYIGERNGVSANVNFGRTNISYNSGYDYNPYVQYDDYGAIIQVESVPVYYDYYGRVSQIGDINVRYNNGRVSRLGGLYVYYNHRGLYSHHRGYINYYNRHYVYRPFHSYFARPAIGFCLVYNKPYRRYYTPSRYTYYRPYRYNSRRAYAKIGHRYKYNKNYNRRTNIYRNDKRVVTHNRRALRNDGLRTSSNSYKRSGNVNTNRTIARSNSTRSNSVRPKKANRGSIDRSRTVKIGTAVRNGNTRSTRPAVNRTVTKREVTSTPRSRTVTRSTKTYKRPEGSNRGRTVSNSTRTKRAVSAKPVRKTSRSTSVTSRSSTPRKVSKPKSNSTRRSSTSTVRKSTTRKK